MRGKRISALAGMEQNRITPADAGKTLNIACGDFERGDHPRGCGENQSYAERTFRKSGSPPRMRGKHRNCRQYAYQHGITPADAGKTGKVYDSVRAC